MGKTVRAATWVVVLGLTASAQASKSVPGVLSYLWTSSNQYAEAPATWGYNAVDGKNTTAWCTGDGPVGQRLILGFAKMEEITHVAIVPGAVVGDHLDESRARVRELELNDGREKRTLTVKDDITSPEVELKPPMNARQLSITIKDVYPSKEENGPACLGELTLRSGPMLLTGDGIGRQVRGVPRGKLALTGPWVDEPSAPERYLTLSLDGTFVWAFRPLMEGEAAQLRGEWDYGNGRLTFKPRGAAKPVVLKVVRDRVSNKQGTFETLSLEGAGGHDKLPGVYQPAVVFSH